MNFAELRFWGLLGAGLGIILLLRALLGACGFRRWELYDRVALASLGLSLLAAVSWLTFGIFVGVLLNAFTRVSRYCNFVGSAPSPRKKTDLPWS